MIRELRNSMPGTPGDSVAVDLSLVARENGGRPDWQLASAENPGVHRIRLTVHPWRQPPPDTSGPDHREPSPGRPPYVHGGGFDETLVGLDPTRLGSAQLPPIVRPKPGVDIERDAD
ncbi:hypothetical protein D2L64_06270 [Micromonospora radicis]|uniref:Uncharacterized protein n=1 Tax=Micromonospora radicis TaxID=1894971 RepID=A0A418MXU3_9ACTN|nr:hypothetical protein D2L64_06270 [Micromonospora radicis]